jgi:hypothetical protein
MPTNEDDPDFIAGFDAEFEELGEHAVRRRLGDFAAGKRAMATNWLDRKATERQRARDWWARGLAIAAMVVAIAAPLLTMWLRGK